MSGASEGVTLLPCPNPWCEGAEGVEASRHIVSGKWHICCDDCMIESPWADSYDLAIAAWNTRTPPPSRSYAEGVEDAAKVADSAAESVASEVMRWKLEQIAVAIRSIQESRA